MNVFWFLVIFQPLATEEVQNFAASLDQQPETPKVKQSSPSSKTTESADVLSVLAKKQVRFSELQILSLEV